MKNAKRQMRTCLQIVLILIFFISQSKKGSSQEFTLPAFIDDITSCDIDLDGDMDIICICQILNYDEDSIFIFYNNGEGIFQRIGYHYPNSGFILCGCIDENEFPDLITRLSYNVYYIPNNGMGEFGSPVTIDNNMGGNMSLVSDVNDDNWNDLIFSVADYENWGIYKNIDGLNFTKEIIQSGSSTTIPAVGYITDDSLPDVVLTYSAFDRSSVNVNIGNFNFTEVVLEETFIGEAFIMNIDNQGTDDFAFLISYSKSIAQYKFIGNDQFERQANYFAEGNYIISSFLPADFNQDGYDDFVITRGDWWNSSDSLYIYFNDQNWSFYLNQIIYIGYIGSFNLKSADLNGDSFPDLYMSGAGTNGNKTLKILWNDGYGGFSYDNSVGIKDLKENKKMRIEISPNPFSSIANIKFTLNETASVSLNVIDILGIQKNNLFNNVIKSKGTYQFAWDGTDFSGRKCNKGLYIIRLEVNGNLYSHKIIYY